MRTNEIQLLPDQRQEIHDLTLLKHSTGLSPPEEGILVQCEADEASSTDIRGND